jgi:hypothetical protein
MWTNHHKRQHQHFLLEQKIIDQKKQKNIEDGIDSSTCRITEGSTIKEPLKQRIKEI